MNNETRKKVILALDFVSLFFTVVGTVLGIMSILALQPLWGGTHEYKESCSKIFTIVTLVVDTTSATCDVTSFFMGKSLYNSVMNSTPDPLMQRLAHHEKYSYHYDEYSAMDSCTGLVFGICSLILICPPASTSISHAFYEQCSINVTIVAIILDFISAVLIILAVDQHMKWWTVKKISDLVRQQYGLGIDTSSIGRHN